MLATVPSPPLQKFPILQSHTTHSAAALNPIRQLERRCPDIFSFSLAGPSGVGKGTLIEKLKADFPNAFGFSVSHTTRAPREGEVDGVHYNFAEKEKMQKEIAAGAENKSQTTSNHKHTPTHTLFFPAREGCNA